MQAAQLLHDEGAHIFALRAGYSQCDLFGHQRQRVLFGVLHHSLDSLADGITPRQPQQIRLDQLVTTKRILDLEQLLEDDSTFYGDLFAHVISWQGDYYLEDGLHRALRAALQQRQTMHARVLELK